MKKSKVQKTVSGEFPMQMGVELYREVYGEPEYDEESGALVRKLPKPPIGDVAYWAKNYDGLQKLRVAVGNRNMDLERRGIEVMPFAKEFAGSLADLEKEIAKRVLPILEGIDIWNEWLVKVKGVGPVMGMLMIGNLRDPRIYPKISNLWSYVGYGDPAKKRKRGEVAGFNVRFKTYCWRLGTQVMKARGYYKGLYDRFKKYRVERDEDEEVPAWKSDAWARRKMIKIFLSHFWIKWRTIRNYPVTEPYAIGVLGHADYMDPDEAIA